MTDEATQVPGIEVQTLDARDWWVIQWRSQRVQRRPRRRGATAARAGRPVRSLGGARGFYWVMLVASSLAVLLPLL
ncbi:MAG: hypothetical protein ACK5V8_07190 [Betaproteobacteria bacterium]